MVCVTVYCNYVHCGVLDIVLQFVERVEGVGESDGAGHRPFLGILLLLVFTARQRSATQ